VLHERVHQLLEQRLVAQFELDRHSFIFGE
jgi:hypothetical protein